ncbi:MAG: hypothetical protein CL723_01780 [Chloroflexi bacterium]|nr:hypothetical protein [Chloroflexota bacterium]
MHDSDNDWTKNFSRKDLADQSNDLINNIITSLYSKKINIFTTHSFSKEEIGILFRWSLYVATNTFVERLINILNKKDFSKKENINKLENYTYYVSIIDFTKNYYYNNKLNYKLISDIKNIFNNKKEIVKKNPLLLSMKIQKTKRSYSLKGMINFLKRQISYFNSSFKKSENIDFLFDNSTWLNIIFEKKNMIKELECTIYKIDKSTRDELRNCFFYEFKKFIDNSIFKTLVLNNKKRNSLSYLFSIWVDCSFSLSIVEGLKDRIKFYNQYTDNYNIKYIHSCLGYYIKENIKVLSILAKRKKAKLVTHEHGVNNVENYFATDSSYINFYKGLNSIIYQDIYFSWGIGKLGDHWNNVEKNYKIKVYNFGSVYLGNLNKIKKINQNNIIILFVNSPLNKFMTNLTEIHPDENQNHQKNVFIFLKKILELKLNVKVLFKNFFANDNHFIKEILKSEIEQNKIIITKSAPTELMNKVDFVLFDMISTGFAEAINIGIPSLVFGHRYHYMKASKDGKIINDKLEKHGMLFYDVISGIQSFNQLINNNDKFIESSKKILNEFKSINSYPISKKLFLEHMNKVL